MSRKTVEKNIAFDDVRNKYYVNLDYGMVDGKRVKKTQVVDKLSEARKILKQFNADKVNENLVAPREETVAEWLDYWLKDITSKKCEETTVYGYKNIINNHINPVLGSVNLQKLTPKMIQNYMSKKLDSGISSNTVIKHYNMLKTSLKVAVMQGVIKNNPADLVVKPKPVKPEIGVYNKEQLKILLELVKGTRLELTVWLCGLLGIRRGELCGLTWDCVDFEHRVINIKESRTNVGSKQVVKSTKSDKSRVLAINDDIIRMLKVEKQSQESTKELLQDLYVDSDYIVVMENGKPYRPNYLSELFTNFINESGLPKITLHGLRHSTASILNASGKVTIYEISKMLGHADIKTTEKIYVEMFDKANKTAMDVMNDEVL